MPETVPDMLRKAAALYEERNKTYGSNYKNFGYWTSELFPEGMVLKSAEDWNRFGVFMMMLSKLSRYAENFHRGGHRDSLDDLAVYAMMLAELDEAVGP